MFGKPKKVKVTTLDDLPLMQRVKARHDLHAMYPDKTDEEGNWTKPKANTDTTATKGVKTGLAAAGAAGAIKTDQEKWEAKKRGK